MHLRFSAMCGRRLAFAITLLAAIPPAWAQSAAVLSLQEAVARASSRSTDAETSRSAVQSAIEMAVAGKQLPDPVLKPGLSNIWVPPIRNRIDMLATGIKSAVGIKVAGTDLKEIDRLATRIEEAVNNVPGVTSALAERLTGGRYIDVDIDRRAAGRYGLNIEDVQGIVSSAIGGENVGEVVDGLARFPINVRYPRDYRDSIEQLRSLPS